MKQKIIALFLCALTIAGAALTSCSSGGDRAETSAQSSGSAPAETAPAVTEKDIYSDLPTGSYGGYEFRVLNNSSNFALTQFNATELNGETINDAVYERNRQVESRLAIKITETVKGYADVTSTMKSAVASGDDEFDIFFNEIYFVVPLGMEGMLINVFKVEGLDLEKPWWNGKIIDSLKIGETLFVLCGDLHFMLQESAVVIGFNKGMVESYKLDSPYKLVNDGSWTHDKMFAMMNAAAKDIDGDGAMTAADQFGAITNNTAVLAFLYSSGEVFIERDKDGLPYFDGLTERMATVSSSVATKFFGSKNVFLNGVTSGLTSGKNWHSVFMEGRGLFICIATGSLKKFRSMDEEFGIVPFPKYDAKQEKYITLTANYASTLGIPTTNKDLARTGVILENICAESHRGVKDAYYDLLLQGKYIRDEDSSAMLDIIFEDRVFSLSTAHGWGGLSQTVIDLVYAGSTNIASAVTGLEPKLKADIAATVEYYAKK